MLKPKWNTKRDRFQLCFLDREHFVVWDSARHFLSQKLSNCRFGRWGDVKTNFVKILSSKPDIHLMSGCLTDKLFGWLNLSPRGKSRLQNWM